MSLYDRLFGLKEAQADPEEYDKRRGNDFMRSYHTSDAEIANAYNKDNPSDAIVGNDALGSGVQGSVWQGPSGRVVKLSREGKEKALHDLLPNYIKKNPITPRDVKTGIVDIPGRVKLSAISREDIPNMDYKDSEEEVGNRIYALNNAFLKTDNDLYDLSGLPPNADPEYPNEPPKDAPRHALNRMGYLKTVYDWHKANQAHPTLSDRDKDSLKRYASGMARYIRHGIVPSDTHLLNVGRRASGDFVMRDQGMYDVLPKTREKPLLRFKQRKGTVIPSGMISPAVQKLKSMSPQKTSPQA